MSKFIIVFSVLLLSASALHAGSDDLLDSSSGGLDFGSANSVGPRLKLPQSHDVMGSASSDMSGFSDTSQGDFVLGQRLRDGLADDEFVLNLSLTGSEQAMASNPIFTSSELAQLEAERGMTPDQIIAARLGSPDWFTRNQARAFALETSNRDPEDRVVEMRALSQDEWFPATLMLAGMAFEGKIKDDGLELYKEAIAQYQARSKELKADDEAAATFLKNLRLFKTTFPEFTKAFDEVLDQNGLRK